MAQYKCAKCGKTSSTAGNCCGAHEGVQVVSDEFRDGGWGEVTLASAVSRPRSRR